MKIVKKILVALAVLIAIAAVAGMFMSSKFSLERSVVINGDEHVIFDQINILKNWEKWSPWKKMDPQMKITYSGPESGVGASYNWTSENKQSGEGSMVISESTPFSAIKTDLDFKEQGKGFSGYKLEKTDGGIKLTSWFESDMGNNPFKKLMAGTMGRGFMTKMLDQGLNDIKQIAESTPASPESVAATPDSTITDSVIMK